MIAKYRRQFEDRYQEVLEKTQKDLKRLKVKMKHFNNCGDWDSVEHYVKDITTMSRKVQEIQKTANWITQEEIQLKYPITSFPEIAEINNYIEPYIRLYVSVHSWRKLLKRWLDGDFHNLNSDDIENQTDEMSRYALFICAVVLEISTLVMFINQPGKCFDFKKFFELEENN